MSDFTSKPELEAVALFLSSYLPPSLSTSFTASLIRHLSHRYSSHWYPQNPEKGSAYRALIRSNNVLDSSLLLAARDVGLDQRRLRNSLDADLEEDAVTLRRTFKLSNQWTLWIDPGLVLLRLDSTSISKGSSLREGQFITIFGSMVPELSIQSLSLAQVIACAAWPSTATSSSAYTSPPILPALPPNLSSSPTSTDDSPSSANKRSKAIQIRPPTRSVSSPIQQQPTPSPPTITPPTPLRPATSIMPDVFSPAPSALRTHSRGSFSSSSSASSSDDDASATSTASSSLSTLWPTSLNRSESPSPPIKMDGEFKYPPAPALLPSRPSSALSSHSAYVFPARPAYTSSTSAPAVSTSTSAHGGNYSRPTSAMSNDSSSSSTSSAMYFSHSSLQHHQQQQSRPLVPSSPTKPRRRGTRGSGSSSNSGHHSTNTSFDLSASFSSSSSSSISNNSSAPQRTREQALAGTLTEYSGNKVGVLSGGVLLGLAGAGMMGSARGEVVGEARRRGRERRRAGKATVIA